MKSPTEEQDIVESSEDSSDSDDKFNAPLGSLIPQRSPQMIREKSPPPPTLDIEDYSDPVPDMGDLINRAVQSLDNVTGVNYNNVAFLSSFRMES